MFKTHKMNMMGILNEMGKVKLSIPLVAILLALSTFTSCKDEVLPKPKAQLRLEYRESGYGALNSDCPFEFQVSEESITRVSEKCWINLDYPTLRASVNMTYRPVENNLKELLLEAEKLTFNHTIKADAISSRPYADTGRRVYGSVFQVTGNAASPLQFHLTDSSRHFITGAVYFDVQPNYDSVRPAIHHLEKDIVRLIESLEWK